MRTRSTKGDRMKLTPQAGPNALQGAAPAAQAETVAAAASATSTSATPSAGPAMLAAAALESDLLKPAQAALAQMPEVDMDRVAALRDALSKGEIRFDANRLAQLIQRFHGGRG